MNELPDAFKNYFTKRSDIHDYPTRHVNDLNITNNKKSFSDQGIRSSGPHTLELAPKIFKRISKCQTFSKYT